MVNLEFGILKDKFIFLFFIHNNNGDIMYIILTLISVVLISISQIISKLCINNTDVYTTTLLKSIFILLISLLFIKNVRINLYIILSSICLTLSWIFYFLSLKKNKLVDVAPIFLLSTSITIILSNIIFKTNTKILFILLGNIIMIKKFSFIAFIEALFLSFQIIFLKLSKINPMNAILVNSIISIFILLPIKKSYKNIKINYILIISVLTFISWLLHYKAINIGNINIVVSLEKINIFLTLILSNLILKEKINKRVIFGFVFFLIGIYLQIVK